MVALEFYSMTRRSLANGHCADPTWTAIDLCGCAVSRGVDRDSWHFWVIDGQRFFIVDPTHLSA